MNASLPGFVCSRESFYLSLLHYSNKDREGSLDRFHKCATQGVVGAPEDPVDAAIHAYSILINNLLSKEEKKHAMQVIIFLQKDYAHAISQDDEVKGNYLISKRIVFELLVNDYNALMVASPPPLREEVLQYLVKVFKDEHFYISSSPMVKKAIATFTITIPQLNMEDVYRHHMSQDVKLHFFAFILNHIQDFIDNLVGLHVQQIGYDIKHYLINRSNDSQSQLSLFLKSDVGKKDYPNARNGVATLRAAVAAAQAAAQAAAAQAALDRLQNPFLQVSPNGAGGSQKRTLRKIKSKKSKKSIKSKKSKKSKSYRKKSHCKK
jgi:hypothetical protein